MASIKGKEQFIKKLRSLKQLNNDFVRIAGREAVRFSKERIQASNWIDERTEPYKRRKPSAKRNRGRKLLVDNGDLVRSIRVTRKSKSTVWVGSDLSYAKAHNEGFRGTVNVKSYTRGKFKTERRGTGSFSIKTRRERTKRVTFRTGESEVKAHTKRINLPQRKFLGESAYLTRGLLRIMRARTLKIIK